MKRFKKNAGFTLVEVIVVLVILAIMAGTMIPAMTGWIQKARKQEAISAARQCVTSAQTVLIEKYAKNAAYQLSVASDGAEILALAELDKDNQYSFFNSGFESKDGVLLHLYLTDGTYYVTYCANYKNGADAHTELYTLNEKMPVGGGLGDASVITQLQSIGSSYLAQSGSLSSQGVLYSPNKYAENYINALQKEGIDLEAMGAKSWVYRTNGCFYWSTTDLSGYKAGDTVPMMRYNYNTKTYTVWNMRLADSTVTNKQTGEKVTYLDVQGETGKVLNPTDQSYEGMMKAYQEATKN